MSQKSLIIFIIIMQLFYTPLKSQNKDRWKAGSANTLSEDVVTLVCFISTPNDNWSDKEKDDRISDLIESHNWLIGQADNYNVDLNLKYYILNNSNDIIFDQIEPGLASGKERVDWVYRTMIKLGFKNSKAAYKSLRKEYKAKNIQVLLYAKGKGRPYSMRYRKGISKKKFFLEGLIVFDRYNNDADMPIAAVTAHEILHLYGAWDLYRTYAQTIDRQHKAAELYPNDIMHRVDHHINTLEINELTAWLIGWNNDYDEIFEWFRPSDYSK